MNAFDVFSSWRKMNEKKEKQRSYIGSYIGCNYALALIFMVILLINTNFVYSSDSDSSGPMIPKGIMLFGIGLTLTAGFLTVVFMINKIMMNPQIDAWVKTEFWQVITTIFIGLIIIILFSNADAIASVTWTGTSWNQTALSHIDDQYYKLERSYHAIGRAYYSLSRYTGFSYSRTKGLPIINWLFTDFETGAPGSGLGPLVGQLSMGFQKLSQSMIILAIEKVLLKFIFFAVPLYLLPIGLIFRAFPFTRSFGSTLLALSIALYFLFPLTLLIFNDILNAVITYSGYEPLSMSNSVESLAGQIDPGDIPGAAVIANPVVQGLAQLGDLGFVIMVCVPACAWSIPFGLWSACWTTCEIIAELVYIVAVPGFQYLLGNWMAGHLQVEAHLNDMFTMVMDNILPLVTFTWIVTIIGFITALVITISSVRGLAGAIGGELQLYGISKLL